MVLSSGKVNKYEYITGEEIWSLPQSQTLEKAKFTYFVLGKQFDKAMEDKGRIKVNVVIQNIKNNHDNWC